MRYLILFAFIVVCFAEAIKDPYYVKLMNTKYCKAKKSVCISCYRNLFKTSSCVTAFKNFILLTRNSSIANKFYSSAVCKKSPATCRKCVNSYFSTKTCTKFKNVYLTPFYPKQVTKDETPKDKTPKDVTPKDETPKENFKAPALTTGLAQNAMSFYKPVSVGKGKAIKSLGNTGVSLYDGLPWDPKDAYELDNDKMDQYENNILAQKVRHSMASDGYCSAKGIESDGVVAADFAALPILAFRDINDAGEPINWSKSARPKKVAAILKEKSTGKIVYLPLTCVGDAKGHAWPGGLAQTFLSSGNQKKGAWKFNSDNGTIKGPIIGKTISDLKTIRDGYSKVTYVGSKVSVQLNLEINKAVKSTLSGYSLEGFISWKA